MSRYARRKDKTHNPIAEYMANHGLQVQDLSGVGGVPDMLVARAGYSAFVEAKNGASSHQQWTKAQLKWISEAKQFNVLYAKTGEEAVRKYRNREFITGRAKDAVAVLLAFAPKDKKIFEPNEVEPLLNQQ